MSYLPHHMAGSVAGRKTAVATPAEVFAGAATLAGRSRLTIRNGSTDKRVRFGVASANLQRDGSPIEPGDEAVLYPTTAIYACSEGSPCAVDIEES